MADRGFRKGVGDGWFGRFKIWGCSPAKHEILKSYATVKFQILNIVLRWNNDLEEGRLCLLLGAADS